MNGDWKSRHEVANCYKHDQQMKWIPASALTAVKTDDCPAPGVHMGRARDEANANLYLKTKQKKN